MNTGDIAKINLTESPHITNDLIKIKHCFLNKQLNYLPIVFSNMVISTKLAKSLNGEDGRCILIKTDRYAWNTFFVF